MFCQNHSDDYLGQTVELVCVASPLSTQHLGEITMTGFLGIKILCLSVNQNTVVLVI